MSLTNKFQEELLVLLKQGNKVKVEVLRFLLTALKNAAIDATGHKLTEADELIILKKEAKKLRESIAIYLKAGRSELAEQENEQLKIIENYLPAQLSEVEIKKIVQSAIESVPDKNFGQIMKIAMAEVAGRAEGQTVSRIVKELLV